jgi:hypothetical protein
VLSPSLKRCGQQFEPERIAGRTFPFEDSQVVPFSFEWLKPYPPILPSAEFVELMRLHGLDETRLIGATEYTLDAIVDRLDNDPERLKITLLKHLSRFVHCQALYLFEVHRDYHKYHRTPKYKSIDTQNRLPGTDYALSGELKRGTN